MAHDDKETTRILLAGGGTGGHIYMAKSIVKAMAARHRLAVLFVGTRRGLEERVFDEDGVTLESIDIRGVMGRGLRGLIEGLYLIPRSLVQSSRIIRRFRPQLAIGMGGYSSGPILLQASRAGVATLIVEPNVHPGATNRWLRRWVDAIAVAFDETAAYFGSKAHVTGTPIREEFFAAGELPRNPSRFRLLVFGGSQGSHCVNTTMTEALPRLRSAWDVFEPTLEIVHQTGPKDLQWVADCYGREGIDAEVKSFLDDMPEQMARADLVVSRAGGGTIGELCAVGRGAILIPYARSADQHQLKNARIMEKAGAVRCLREEGLTGDQLADEILRLAQRPELRVEMERSARKCAHPQAALQIAELASRLLERRLEHAPRIRP